MTMRDRGSLGVCVVAVALGLLTSGVGAGVQLAETHLKNVRQLTSGGENAEAYFSADGSRLIYQTTRGDYPCDQIYTMKVDGTDVHRVSTGAGRTTCGYY